MRWLKTNYHAQLGYNKGSVIKGLVVYMMNGRFTPQLRCFKVRGEV